MINLIKLLLVIGLLAALLNWFGAPAIIVRILCILAAIAFLLWFLAWLGFGSILPGIHY